ncbi:MAG: RNA methyltransferase [Magnetococcales bacterium]|nr:RNA methyltransferase [Magnetococcales bacterium]
MEGESAMSGLELASRCYVILDRPAQPGNIGATARAMRNTGFSHLRMITPREFPHPDADNFAVGAVDVLQRAELFASLPEAVGDLTFLVAATNRPRKQRQPIDAPRQLAQRLTEVLARPDARVGLLFGNERTGLETVDVERADVLCNIPTTGDYGSLNLAQAVLIILHELMLGMGAGRNFAFDPRQDAQLADRALLERFYAHLEETLTAIDFIKPGQSRHMMGSLRALFNRAALDRREVAILRGVLAEVEAVRVRDRKAWERHRTEEGSPS